MFDQLLIHTAEVRRRTGEIDRFGQPADQNPSDTENDTVLGPYRCRLTRGKGGMVNEERSLDVFEVMHELFFPIGTDIREDDVVSVTDVDGTVILPTAKVKIKATAHNYGAPHHLEVMVSVQRGPI